MLEDVGGSANAASDRGLHLRIHRAGIRDELVPHASREQQLAEMGLDRAGIAKRIRGILGIGTAIIAFPLRT